MAPDEHKLSLLLHDSQEFACADVNSPLKSLLPQYKEIENRAEKVIAKKYGIPYPHPPIVKEIDIRMLVTEMKQLIRGDDWKHAPLQPFDIKLPCWNFAKAKREFLKRFRQYS